MVCVCVYGVCVCVCMCVCVLTLSAQGTSALQLALCAHNLAIAPLHHSDTPAPSGSRNQNRYFDAKESHYASRLFTSSQNGEWLWGRDGRWMNNRESKRRGVQAPCPHISVCSSCVVYQSVQHANAVLSCRERQLHAASAELRRTRGLQLTSCARP
jgi:hypothetical protein